MALSDLVKKLTTRKSFPIVGDTPLRTPKLVPRPAPFLFFSFAFSRSIIHGSVDFHVVYGLQTEEQNGEAWELGYTKPSSNNLLGAIARRYTIQVTFMGICLHFNFVSHDL